MTTKDTFDGDILESNPVKIQTSNIPPQSSPLEKKKSEKDKLAKTKDPEDSGIKDDDINAYKSFEKYAGVIYDPGDFEFENVNDIKIRKISSKQQEYSNFPSKPQFETPLQRYNRLNDEIISFQNDLKDSLKDYEKIQKDPCKSLFEVLNNEVNKLSSTLNDVVSNSLYQPFLSSEVTAPTLQVPDGYTRLVTQLSHYQNQNLIQEKKEEKRDKNSRLTYELYLPSKSEISSNQIKEIENRLCALEKIIGHHNEKPIHYVDIRSCLESLLKKMDILSKISKNKGEIITINLKLQQTIKDLDIFLEKKSRLIDKTPEDPSELYNMMIRWDNAAQQLPLVISRLKSLKTLHLEATKAVLRVQQLDESQKSLGKLLEDDRSGINELMKSMQTNHQTILSNINNLNQRIDKLMKTKKK